MLLDCLANPGALLLVGLVLGSGFGMLSVTIPRMLQRFEYALRQAGGLGRRSKTCSVAT
jgi:ABC-type enterochelin transport system permease subunit